MIYQRQELSEKVSKIAPRIMLIGGGILLHFHNADVSSINCLDNTVFLKNRIEKKLFKP